MYRRKLYGLDTQLVSQSFHLRTDGLALGAVDQRCHKVVRQRVEAEVLRCRPFSIGQVLQSWFHGESWSALDE